MCHVIMDLIGLGFLHTTLWKCWIVNKNHFCTHFPIFLVCLFFQKLMSTWPPFDSLVGFALICCNLHLLCRFILCTKWHVPLEIRFLFVNTDWMHYVRIKICWGIAWVTSLIHALHWCLPWYHYVGRWIIQLRHLLAMFCSFKVWCDYCFQVLLLGFFCRFLNTNVRFNNN